MCGEICAATGDWISFASGLALMALGCLVVVAYRPKGSRNRPERTLALAIFLGFLAHGGNAFYWQVLGHPLVYSGLLTIEGQRNLGDYLDLFFKGGGAVAAYLHLRALWLSLPAGERHQWRTLEMAFYPHRMLALRRGLKQDED
ncbi:hypothetical protein [Mameliella sediminis]|uniref:hypothetical protein n=1 Tax=Mameliella sediminis TaxID=2836866 RepID=UPI001C4503E6|nr:hypothetical protein [Mameliella sediminis]MBV7394544.1 hypothetical protein [Mameliella sediminis]